MLASVRIVVGWTQQWVVSPHPTSLVGILAPELRLKRIAKNERLLKMQRILKINEKKKKVPSKKMGGT